MIAVQKITEQRISFDTAKLAKKAGVNVETNKFYTHRGTLCESVECDNQNAYYGSYSAVTQSLLQKWFREKYNIHVTIAPEKFDSSNTCIYKWYIFNRRNASVKLDSYGIVGTYEETLEEGLQQAFKYIKS